jgi:hypothetical protein
MGQTSDNLSWESRPAATPSQRGITIAAAILFLITQLPLARWCFPGADVHATIGGEGAYWLLTAVLVLFVVKIERRSLSSIGLVLSRVWN